ncbi:MAG: MBL fold metallo-hydrolase RNA specificity domain-containing protein [Bacteroidota bacterium]
MLKDPAPIEEADYLICESTYGKRLHQEKSTPLELIKDVIYKACVQIPGRLIIPAFSVGRTQTLLFLLNQLQKKGELPKIQIFTDSPLAKKSTRIYDDFVSFMNEEAQAFCEEHNSLFDFENLAYLENINSAEEIDNYGKPCIIITSSGMVRGGKSEEHILRNLNNSYCTILFIGYCSEGTLGRRLIDGLKTFRSGDEDIPVHARIISSDVLSGHGDLNDLLALFESQNIKRLKQIFLVHGEPDALEHLQGKVEGQGFEDVVIPQKGDPFVLD